MRTNAEVEARFGSTDFLVVALETDEERGIFCPEPLNWILRTSNRVRDLDGVRHEEVRSLATVVSGQWREGALAIEPPIRATVETLDDADRIRASAHETTGSLGFLVARNEAGAAVYVPLNPGIDRPSMYRRILNIGEEELAAMPSADGEQMRVHVLGPAAAESLLGEHILSDLLVLFPLSLGVIAVMLLVSFRSSAVVLIGLGEAAVVVLLTFGLMGALDKRISLVTVIVPVILSTYCVADTIHLASRFINRSAEMTCQPRREVMNTTLDEIVDPLVFTSMTTCAGFLSFVLSPIPALREFGTFAAAGTFIALIFSLSVVPGALLKLGLNSRRQSRRIWNSIGATLGALAETTARRPASVVTAFVLLSLFVCVGIQRLRIQDSWVDNFSRSSRLVRSNDWFNSNFYGSNTLNLVLQTGEPRGCYQPEFLAHLQRLQQSLEKLEEVGGVRSLLDPLESVAHTLEGRVRIPKSWQEANEWALLYEIAVGVGGLDAYVDTEAAIANVWVFLNRADYRRTARLVHLATGHQPTDKFSPVLAGDSYIGYKLIDSIVESQVSSLFLAVASTSLLALVILRSISLGLMAILPVCTAVLWNFGLMGWLGLPLGVATSTFSAISIGIGIDLALHWLSRFQASLSEQRSLLQAVSDAAETTGTGILLNALALVLGFGVLLFSAAPPNRQLGALMCINLAACLLSTLVLLPASCAILYRRSNNLMNTNSKGQK